MQRFSKVCALVVAAALAGACGLDRSRNVLVPSDVPSATPSAPQPGANATPSLIGMWVAATTTTESSVGAKAITTPTSCPTFTFTISSQTATEASGTYAAPDFRTPSTATSISKDRRRLTPTRIEGPMDFVCSKRASRFARRFSSA